LLYATSTSVAAYAEEVPISPVTDVAPTLSHAPAAVKNATRNCSQISASSTFKFGFKNRMIVFTAFSNFFFIK
jgi:hypothetical protein